jgi:uncharacterized membrane protein YkvA (DUF1232 family)
MSDQPPPPPEQQPDPPIPTDGKAPSDTTGFAKYFTEGAFWDKVKGFASKVGRATLTKVMELYNVAVSKDTPLWAKAVAIGSLGYFILPLDAVPDLIPGLGLADDAAALATAATMIIKNITPAVKAKAAEQVAKWFGPDPNAPAAPPEATPDAPPAG